MDGCCYLRARKLGTSQVLAGAVVDVAIFGTNERLRLFVLASRLTRAVPAIPAKSRKCKDETDDGQDAGR